MGVAKVANNLNDLVKGSSARGFVSKAETAE